MAVPDAAPLPCAGKARYPNRKRAAQAAGQLRKRITNRTGQREPIHPYHCSYCSGYHVGHPCGWRKANCQPRSQYRLVQL